jgi:hypothetical protein
LAVSVISGYGVMLAIVQHNPAVAGLSQYWKHRDNRHWHWHRNHWQQLE